MTLLLNLRFLKSVGHENSFVNQLCDHMEPVMSKTETVGGNFHISVSVSRISKFL